MATPFRYAITHYSRTYKARILTRANQGRDHFTDRAEAEAWLEAVRPGYAACPEIGIDPDTLRVSVVPAYDHGDARGSLWDDIPCEHCGETVAYRNEWDGPLWCVLCHNKAEVPR